MDKNYAQHKKMLNTTKLVNPYKIVQNNPGIITHDLKDYSSTNTVIAIGSSTGGIQALEMIITHLPKDMPPILIVQHLGKAYTKSFADRLNLLTQLTVKEAEHLEPLKSGTVYIAPGDLHMEIIQSKKQYMISLNDGPKINYHRPSVEALFFSMSKIVKENAVGVILTGMGADGASGLKLMKDQGAHTIAQDESTSTVFGMPRRAIELNAVKETLPIHQIGIRLKNIVDPSHLNRINQTIFT